MSESENGKTMLVNVSEPPVPGDPFHGMKPKIGVMGACQEPIAPPARERARELGRAIARTGCILITGGSAGLPYDAVLGAKEKGGFVLGISPGLSLAEHVYKYESPHEGFDLLVFTGSGLMGREVDNIRSSDIVIIIGGRSGTLGEFAIAYDEGKLIGALTGTGGIADQAEHLAALCDKETGAHVISDSDPEQLLDRLLDYYRSTHCYMPSCFG